MATQPFGEANQQRLWNDTLSRLHSLSNETLKRNARLEERVMELEEDIRLTGAMYVEASQRDLQAHERLVFTLNQELAKRDLFEHQSPLILCVINGDNRIFNGPLISQGRPGGYAAAEALTQAIATYLTPEGLGASFGRVSFWITVYFNKGELVDKLVANNICSVDDFDAFLAGFSQTSPRFCLIDVGFTGGTDVKMDEYIQVYARFPQTLRVFVAGAEDQLYVSTFNALDREKLLGKLVMLNGNAFNLPFHSLNVDEVFMPQPLPQSGHKPAPLNMNSYGPVSGLISPQSPASQTSGRIIDASLPLHKQNPPPCNEHYLMQCSKGRGACKYSHDYALTPEQLASLANNAKKAPCNWLKNGLDCPYGDKCCWGHFCPNGAKCFHLSKGKCWFKGDAMHLNLY
ncbi:hypothetical protein FB45DRAFT_903524 [Roridomyces roridus]|uniref:C3H1-type domain-containing protein n=1 Tax=Roridomyces roridus TaxID=1738132 RepID=A0AAD7C690_9AGAR|nr:hypothetical protein FB45DRAFT_903524 [Roridomyces roridus]